LLQAAAQGFDLVFSAGFEHALGGGAGGGASTLLDCGLDRAEFVRRQ
jgi:hypothetical protein